MNREERRQFAMRVRRGLASEKEIEASFARRRAGRGGVGAPWGTSGSPTYVAPDGRVLAYTENPSAVKGVRLLPRGERRRIVGAIAWRVLRLRAPALTSDLVQYYRRLARAALKETRALRKAHALPVTT